MWKIEAPAHTGILGYASGNATQDTKRIKFQPSFRPTSGNETAHLAPVEVLNSRLPHLSPNPAL